MIRYRRPPDRWKRAAVHRESDCVNGCLASVPDVATIGTILVVLGFLFLIPRGSSPGSLAHQMLND